VSFVYDRTAGIFITPKFGRG